MNSVSIIIIFAIVILLHDIAYAYNPKNHHRHMGVRAADESNLDAYLKDNLGFSRGINTTLTNPDEPEGEQTKKIYEWVGYGGIQEDIGMVPLSSWPRVTRHFYDSVSNQGLNDRSPSFESSLEWGREQERNRYSWVKARENYYLALTSRTEEERERYWALTFRSLGQVLHLVQDLASPAHVRNDNHLPISNNADPYEEIWGTSPVGISFIHPMLAHGALGNADYQYPAVQLDRFEDYWDTESGQGLAEFTNSNFVSKDTNLDKAVGDPRHYDNPQATGEHRESFTFTDSTGRVRTMGVNYITSNVVDNYAPGRSVNPFNYLTTHSFFNFYTEQYDLTQRSYTLNRKCHEEYAKLLIPRTVGYGAGLLNYFFRGELDVDVETIYEGEERYISSWIFKFTIIPESEFEFEELTGDNFEIYYDTDYNVPVTERRKIEEVEYIFEEDRVIAKVTINSLSPGLRELRGFMVVYRGGLGGEEVVIGKKVFCYSADFVGAIDNASDATIEFEMPSGDRDDILGYIRSQYSSLRNQAWGEYVSGIWRFAYGGFSLPVDRTDSQGIEEFGGIYTYSLGNSNTRGYMKFDTGDFSSINSVKLIGFWHQYGNLGVDINYLVFKVNPWSEPFSISAWGGLGSLVGSFNRRDVGQGGSNNINLDIYEINSPLYFEIKSDIENINFAPISYDENWSSTYYNISVNHQRHIYLLIDGQISSEE